MLKIKGVPTQLQTHEIDAVWPGDDAVNIEASDLLAWAVHGGRRGLQFHSGKDPAVIRVRPLVDRETARITAMFRRGDPNTAAEAFRYGAIEVPGVTLLRERTDGVVGLTDQTIDFLAEETVPLPFAAALHHAYGVEFKGKATNIATGLPWAIGVHILAATFR